MDGKQSTAVLGIETEEAENVLSTGKRQAGYIFFKRIFDFIFSLVVGLVLLIPMAIIAVIIMVKDPGNPFYMQRRIGKNGEEIKIAKFRTMRVGADELEHMLTPSQIEEYKIEFKLKDDPRLIGYKNPGDGAKCFGAKLRQLSIDELPQIIWNICIKGNMSIVGPRPILREELDCYYTPEQQELLLSVKPGLTGYWQAYARNNAGYEDGTRQQMELHYVTNSSLWLDLKIIFATFGAVIRKSGI